ncbi:MAG: TauD/TfdA family dioxygenase [Pseudomonadota bacterium]
MKAHTMALQTRSLHPEFGLEIQALDLASMSDAEFDALYTLWRQEPLLLLRRQAMTEGELVAFSRRFGELDILVRDDLLSREHPEVIYVTNLMRADGTPLGGLGSYELNWHHDQIYRQRPPTGSIFQAVEMPQGHAATSWCSTRHTFEALPAALRERVAALSAVSKYGLRPDAGFQRDLKDAGTVQQVHDRTPPATHPMVLRDPGTGTGSLYVDPKKVMGVEGLDDADASKLLGELLPRLVDEAFVYTHAWRPGDIVLWDNARLMHRRDAFDASLPRLAKRTTIHLNPEHFAVP